MQRRLKCKEDRQHLQTDIHCECRSGCQLCNDVFIGLKCGFAWMCGPCKVVSLSMQDNKLACLPTVIAFSRSAKNPVIPDRLGKTAPFCPHSNNTWGNIVLSSLKLCFVALTAEAEGQVCPCNQVPQCKRNTSTATDTRVMAHGSYLHSALVGLRNLAHIKGGILCTLPKQILAPKLGAAAMVGQHNPPPPLQLIVRGHGLRLCSHKN